MGFAPINTTELKIPAIEEGFATSPSLKKRVYDATAATPQHQSLFEDIGKHISSLLDRNANTALELRETIHEGTAPATKKRKLQNGDASGQIRPEADPDANSKLVFYIKDVSFSVPQRKKFTLELTEHRYLRTRNQTTREIEFGISLDQIQHILCLPVPEKTQKQFNFCIIPRNNDGINSPPAGESAPEAMVWTVMDGAPKTTYSGSHQPLVGADGETTDRLVQRILNDSLAHTQVVRPDEREFVSAMPEAHRKGEKAYHVKAFRGSKEGYLFFLSTGILFGFKKPLIFFAFENIESISYTSVLQRTFNLSVMTRPNGSEETQEFELSMIDQADYAGIDGYIKGHGLQDASLAETRRAKRYNINGGKAGEKGGEVSAGGAVEEESELQKAQRELEDQEDEEEEDYDPGSESDSDGSGTSSEDESQGEEGHDDGDDGDLVDEEEELGSPTEAIKQE